MENEMKKTAAAVRKTERLALRPFRAEDESDVLTLLQNEEIKLTYMLPDFPTKEAAVKLFRRLAELSLDEGHFVRAICLGERVIGFLNDVEIENGEIEVGYVIHPSVKNRGYATEALSAAIVDLFGRGYAAVCAGYFEENPASGRVMEKCGMRKIDKTDEIEYRGKRHHCVYCEIRKANMA